MQLAGTKLLTCFQPSLPLLPTLPAAEQLDLITQLSLMPKYLALL